MISLARALILLGAILLIAGGALYLVARTGMPLGRLPGDIRIQGNSFTCVIALGTSLLLSIILTIGLNLVVRWLNR